MFDLTPGERRGAVTLLILLLLGAAHDLWQARQPPRPLPERAGVPDPQAMAPGPSDDPGPRPAAAAGPAGALLDLDRATLAELDALPGIGPVLAARIVAERSRLGHFRSREDLLAVPGIGPKLYARLAPLVTVGGSPAAAPAPAPGPGTPTR